MKFARSQAMQYRGIRAFCIAAEQLSFKLAADELAVTPSAVSHQIRDLDAYLGCTLFVRGTRSISLTLEGQRLYMDLREPVEKVNAAVKRLKTLPNRVPLRIEMPAFFTSELFLPRMSDFSQCNQHIDLRIETTAPSDPESRRANLHIVLSNKRPPALCAKRLFRIRYQPACSRDLYAEWRDKTPQDLNGATLLVHESRPDAWQQWFVDADLVVQTPRQTITVDSMYGLARATQQGAGIALIPLPVSQQWFDNKELIALFDNQITGSDYYWLTTNEPLTDGSAVESALATLWNWVVSEFSDDG